MKYILVRMALKRRLRKARHAGDFELVDVLTQTLEDDDVLELVVVAAESQYDYERSDAKGDFGGRVRDFLEWLKDYLPQLIEIITTIIQLLAIFAAESEEEEE